MKKVELLESILSILDNHKIKNEKLTKELTDLIGPKIRIENNPDKLDKDGKIIEIYCIRIGEYLSIDEFSKSSKSKNGYSKESKIGIKIWNKYNKEIQNLKLEINGLLDKMLESKITAEEAKESKIKLESKIKEWEEIRKNPYGLDLFNETKDADSK